MKIFNPPAKPFGNVRIFQNISSPYKEQLNQAKGVMENYLRDKNFNINIYESSSVLGSQAADYLDIQLTHPKTMRIMQVKKDTDTPFLRKVYKALEEMAREFKLNNLK